MTENLFANSEAPPVFWAEGSENWLIPITSELATNVWPESLDVLSTKMALSRLVLVNKNHQSGISNGHMSRPPKPLAVTDNVTIFPWVIPYHTIGIYIHKVALNFVDITALKHSEKKLQQNQEHLVSLNTELREQVSQLTSEVLIAEQRVLEYVARLLHDELQQHLTFILMKIQAIRQLLLPSELALQIQMQELREAADLAFAITRQVAVDLNPPMVLNEDFVESLNLLGKVMKKRYGLAVELKGDVRLGLPKEELCRFLFQTVRELLFNVVKHAEVTEAQVVISEADGRLSITVSDEGQGFDAAAALEQPATLGLFTIRRRVELFGGQFQIQSQVGLGTQVSVRMLI